MYADYFWINVTGKKYGEVKPKRCDVKLPYGEWKTCHSEEDFNELVKVYMEQ